MAKYSQIIPLCILALGIYMYGIWIRIYRPHVSRNKGKSCRIVFNANNETFRAYLSNDIILYLVV